MEEKESEKREEVGGAEDLFLPRMFAHGRMRGEEEEEKIFSPSCANEFALEEMRERRMESFFHPLSLVVVEELFIMHMCMYGKSLREFESERKNLSN